MLQQYRSTLHQLSAEYPLIRMALLHHRSKRGGPLMYRDKPSLIELLIDQPSLDEVVICKCVQNGVTEIQIMLALERAGWEGRIVAYVLPTHSARDRFVTTRVNPLLEKVAAYRARCPGGDLLAARKGVRAFGSLKLKRFGAGELMFLGSNTPTDFREFSTDVIIIDELDDCDPTNLALARDRLRASDHPQEVRLGNPSIPRVGISRLYDDTDQRLYHFQCDHCNERQPMDWFLNIVKRGEDGSWVPRDTWAAKNRGQGGDMPLRPVCRRCDKPFNRVGESSQWVATNMGVERRGYRMSRLDILSEDLWELYVEFMAAQGDTAALASFFSGILGLAYEHAGSRLTGTMLQAVAIGHARDMIGGDRYRRLTVTAGVDVGAVLNLTITVIQRSADPDNPRRIARLVIAYRSFEEIADALERFHVDLCVIDADPETRKCEELRDYFRDESDVDCIVWLCRFHPHPRVDREKYGMRLDYGAQLVTVNRTGVFDAAFDDIAEQRRQFPGDVFQVMGWSQQMCAPARRLNERGSMIIWTKGPPDHYRLSDVYDRVALDLLGRLGG